LQLESSQRRPDFGWYRHGPLRFAIDEDVDEVPGGGGEVVALFEDRQLVTHARVSELADTQTDVDRSRESEWPQILTLRLDGEGDDSAGVDVESARGDQILVDGRVEEGVLERVVDVTVDVVVHPTRRQRTEVRILGAGDLWFRWHQ
jgi:hypothetical protein